MKKISAFLLIFAIAFAQGEMGGWHFSKQIDDFSDEDRSYIALTSENKDAVFFFRCADKRLEAFVSTDDYLNSDDDVPTLYRFDKNEPSSLQQWSVSTKGTAAFMKPEYFTDFIKEGLGAKNLIIRVTDYSDRDYTHKFNWLGFRTAISKLNCFSMDSLE